MQVKLANTPCTAAPFSVLLQLPTFRVIAAGRIIRSAWLFCLLLLR
jgi:hypothetical protein